MPTAHIWKTALEAARGKAGLSHRNLHIGKTMRDLYFASKEGQNEKIDDLLEELRKRETPSKK
ncbi:hypothetical protein [Ensifer sp. MJa1]|uniref:hypothetical protein n=1 Tax=Ensifer sp. MJa1 TaxID=2919888 RepID=UPI0030095046